MACMPSSFHLDNMFTNFAASLQLNNHMKNPFGYYNQRG
ncbi:hypothetical protein STFR1_50036 [Bacillus vallismortis]